MNCSEILNSVWNSDEFCSQQQLPKPVRTSLVFGSINKPGLNKAQKSCCIRLAFPTLNMAAGSSMRAQGHGCAARGASSWFRDSVNHMVNCPVIQSNHAPISYIQLNVTVNHWHSDSDCGRPSPSFFDGDGGPDDDDDSSSPSYLGPEGGDEVQLDHGGDGDGDDGPPHEGGTACRLPFPDTGCDSCGGVGCPHCESDAEEPRPSSAIPLAIQDQDVGCHHDEKRKSKKKKDKKKKKNNKSKSKKDKKSKKSESKAMPRQGTAD